MSDEYRQRYLFLKNRLEELAAKYGSLPDEQLPTWLDSTDADPTWGPVGTLARKWMTEQEISWLMAMDRDLRSIHGEASERPVSPPPPPEAPPPQPEPPPKPRPRTRKPRGSDW